LIKASKFVTISQELNILMLLLITQIILIYLSHSLCE